MNDLNDWLDRVDNALNVQKETGEDTMPLRLTRRELVQLKMMVETLMDWDDCERCEHADWTFMCRLCWDMPGISPFGESGKCKYYKEETE